MKPPRTERLAPDFTLPAAEDPHARAAAGTVLSGRYRLDRQLGAGGMGQVWVAEHLGLGVPVAVKLIHAFLADTGENARRFAHEAHALSLLRHPNVVRVMDFGAHAGATYLVMELLGGKNLAERIDEADDLLPLELVTRVSLALCDALEAIHGAGVVHRDLKPANVFLSRSEGADEVVKLVDFGLAHVDDPRDESPLTKTGMMAGTPAYMSPEQCRSLRVGPSADLYALGCILTEMLQGEPPFAAGTAVDLISRQLFSPPPALSRPSHAPPVPPLLERLRLDLLAKSPERRPATAAEVRERLLVAMAPALAAEALPDRSRAALRPRADRSIPPPPAPGTTPTRSEGARVHFAKGDTSSHRFPAGEASSQFARTGHSAKLDDTARTALEAHGYQLTAQPDEAEVVVVDVCGVAEAEAWLQRYGGAAPTVLCLDIADVSELSRLVASGAGAVLLHPVGHDRLAAAIEKVLRRRQRKAPPPR